MTVQRELLDEIEALRGGLPHVAGVLVAGVDGLLVAHDTEGFEPDLLAAMSAAQLGLGQQLARAVVRGDFQESVTRTSHGYVAVFAAGPEALLTVVAEPDLNLGRLHHEARPVAARIGALLARPTGS